ncbi:MAG: UDP-N-acetylmuramoyl-tripeptide--D-alanyl-D-alanine ligase, partial [Anaerolineales bacterium]|nr:UDP-N-acetylmuramoyl-tripeptide--D-alanyl-D-alanine ligase [Anaerolineales bacterium]
THQTVVLEMGMYAIGEIALLCEIAQPQIGVVTNIAPVHLSRLGTIENIVTAKRELVEALPVDGVAILNQDDERVLSMASASQARVFTYGLAPEADLWADNIESMGLDGIRCTLHYQGEQLTIQVPLIGRHSVHTVLRATAVGLVTGMTWDEIIRGLQSQQAQLRLVTVAGPQGSIIIDDSYNASPESVIAALNLLADLDGRRLAVLGDMLELGDEEVRGHHLVGRRAAAVVQELVVVGERARLIGEAAIDGGLRPAQVHFIDEAPAALPLLRELIQPADFVLVKGSLGMRMDRIVTELREDS